MRSLAERLRAFEERKARLADTEAKLKLAERRARTRRLIEAGTLAEKAGLSDLSAEALYGAFLSLRSGIDSAKQVDQWTSAGALAMAQDAEQVSDSEPIVLTFRIEPDKDATIDLRSNGFRFNRVLRHWEGVVSFALAQELAEAHGGSVRKISYSAQEPAPAPIATAAE